MSKIQGMFEVSNFTESLFKSIVTSSRCFLNGLPLHPQQWTQQQTQANWSLPGVVCQNNVSFIEPWKLIILIQCVQVKEVKRGTGFLFHDYCVKLWMQLLFWQLCMEGGLLYLPPDCFGVNRTNYVSWTYITWWHKRVWCDISWAKKQYTKKEIVCWDAKTIKRGTTTPFHVWWQNGLKCRFPFLTSLV